MAGKTAPSKDKITSSELRLCIGKFPSFGLPHSRQHVDGKLCLAMTGFKTSAKAGAEGTTTAVSPDIRGSDGHQRGHQATEEQQAGQVYRTSSRKGDCGHTASMS